MRIKYPPNPNEYRTIAGLKVLKTLKFIWKTKNLRNFVERLNF